MITGKDYFTLAIMWTFNMIVITFLTTESWRAALLIAYTTIMIWSLSSYFLRALGREKVES
jgi:hypothetical protein